MNFIYEDAEKIKKFAPIIHGVFTKTDLRTLFNSPQNAQFFRRIKNLEKKGVLKRFSKNIYITKERNLEVLSQKLCENSYISFGNTLASELLSGTISQFQISAVKMGKKRSKSGNFKNTQ
jgi:hypothetical protein